MTGMDVHRKNDLAFPKSLPEFQRLFPDDATCAAYLERARWADGFVCPYCRVVAEPFRIATRPGILECRTCRRQTGLLAGTVMERSHTPLNIWFWAAYLVVSHTPGISAVQFQRQLGLSRYETAFGILHKLRAGMVRPAQERIGGNPDEHVEADETYVGGRTRGEGRGVHHKVLVACAVEVHHRKLGTAQDKRKDGRYAGRVRLAVTPDRSADSLCGFVESAVAPGTLVVTDDWSGYNRLSKSGYNHQAIAECGDPEVADDFLPIIHLVFANLKTWLLGTHHGVSAKHLQAYLNEFTFRFNRRFYPFNAFRSLLGIAGGAESPTFAELYSGDWVHPTFSGCLR
jgi:transposase-like protein